MEQQALRLIENGGCVKKARIAYLESELLEVSQGFLDEGGDPVLFGELGHPMSVSEILDYAGGEAKAVVNVKGILKLVEDQESGDSKTLLVNGLANLFFIRKSGILYLVGVIYKERGWNISRYPSGISLSFSSSTLLFVGKK